MRLSWIINAALFQLCWWSAALFSQRAVLIMSATLILHLALSPTKLDDLKLLPLALIGIVVDQLLISFGVIDVKQSMIPIWLVLLWIILTWSLNHSLSWLSNIKLWQVAILGGVLGATSYLAAIELGAISTPLTLTVFTMIEAIIWCGLLPALCVLRQRLIDTHRKEKQGYA